MAGAPAISSAVGLSPMAATALTLRSRVDHSSNPSKENGIADSGGSFRVVNAPYRLSAGVTKVREFSADLGQHTREVLRGAGYSDAEIDALAGSGAINTA